MDEKILRKYFEVSTFKFRYRKGWRLIPEMIRELFSVLKKIWFIDIVFIWFADFHSVIPTLLGRLAGKKVVIVIGGYDAAFEPDLKYGVKTKIIGRLSASISIKFSSYLLPVTQFTYQDLLKNFGRRFHKKSKVIFNCYNDIFKCDSMQVRKSRVVTICLAHSKITVIRKGVDYFVRLGEQLPEVEFFVVGVTDEAFHFLEKNKPSNVHLISKMPQSELKNILCNAKVICQFSRYEAFGIALLEGISAGCYPVGFDYGGTSEILEDGLGILIDELDLDQGKNAIQEAMKKNMEDVLPIQKSIEERFAIRVREQNLVDFISKL
jgi:glycosyltransferase involved in cell wall biosynthesis